MHPKSPMSRVAKSIKIADSDMNTLVQWSKSRTISKQQYDRAHIILSCSRGQPVEVTARELNTYSGKIRQWRDRYILNGLSGLIDKQRSGRPIVYVKLRESLLELLKSPVPEGYSRWDAPLLASKLGCSKDIVWRILKSEGISLKRQRSWCISTDKDFAAKAADIVGIYIEPPLKAIVLCVDEKPSIQALERRIGYIETSDGKIMRAYKSTYKRNGTLNLFAALNVATGHVSTKTTKAKTREDFLKFMNELVAEYLDQELHVILDNYCTHKKNEKWLIENQNVHFHFTPTSASWLNQVEIWFGIFSRKSLNGASFSSTEKLAEHIEHYVESYNKDCMPFKWKKREVRGSQIKNTIENLCN